MSSKQIEGIKAHPDFEYFDPRQVALQREMCNPHWEQLRFELANHPELVVQKDMMMQLTYIATYVEIILEGDYEYYDLCEVICNRMIELRKAAEAITVENPK